MSEWIRAEDAIDQIEAGTLVFRQYIHHTIPEIMYFTHDYSPITSNCNGWFFRVYDIPHPQMNHDLPERTHPHPYEASVYR